MKHIKTVCAFLLPAFLLSCASAPLSQEEGSRFQKEEQQEETEEQMMPQEPEHGMEEPQADGRNPQPETEAEQDTEIIYEPVEDIEGYYESDPEPVFLEPAPAQPDEEQQEDIPAAEAAPETQEEPQPQEAESAPETHPEPLDGETAQQDESGMEAPSAPELPAQEPQEEEFSGESTEPEPEQAPDTPAESAEPLPQEPETERQSKAAVPSRSVLIKNSQYLDVAYPGKGWIYLGEENGKQLMRYFGRKIGEQNTLFSLRSKEEGSTVLHFYKSDPLTGTFIDDYLAVTVQGKSTDQQRASAPDYAEVVPPRPEKAASPVPEADRKPEPEKNVPAAIQEPQENQAAAPQAAQKEIPLPPQSGTQLSDSDAQQHSPDRDTSAGDKSGSLKKAESGQDLQADELLKKARAHLESRQYKEALSCLEEFFEKATSRIDEGLYLQGQVFESNSSVRNIRSALDTYETIVRRYPQSAYWTQANNRAIYLKKFYFNIR